MTNRWCDVCQVGSTETECWYCGGPVRIGTFTMASQSVDRTVATTSYAPTRETPEVGWMDTEPLPELTATYPVFHWAGGL